MTAPARILNVALGVALVVGGILSADEPGKETARSQYLTVNSGTSGFCGMCKLDIDKKPAAAFGLYQAPGGKPQYTFLILFKPDPKAERGGGVLGDGAAQNDSDGGVSCDLKMKALAAGREVEVRLQLARDAKTVTKDIVTIGGRDYGPDGPRVFLVDLAAEKPVPIAVNYKPTAVPALSDEDGWAKQILAARKELIEKSEVAKKFFGGK